MFEEKDLKIKYRKKKKRIPLPDKAEQVHIPKNAYKRKLKHKKNNWIKEDDDQIR